MIVCISLWVDSARCIHSGRGSAHPGHIIATIQAERSSAVIHHLGINAEANSQLVKADLAKSSAGILSGSRSVRHGVRTVSNQLFRLASSQLAKADLEKSSAGISSGFRSSQQ
jgi:hypothetical protein